MGDLKLPAIDYGALAPMLILFGVACLGVLVEAFTPRRSRNVVQLVLGFYPKPVTDVINPAVQATMHDVGTTDPGPTAVANGKVAR